jgi:hypothetical protein
MSALFSSIQASLRINIIFFKHSPFKHTVLNQKKTSLTEQQEKFSLPPDLVAKLQRQNTSFSEYSR